MPKTMLAYESFFEAAESLPDDLRLQFYDAIFRYCFRDEVPEPGTTLYAMFALARPNIDSRNQSVEFGRKGGSATSGRGVDETRKGGSATTGRGVAKTRKGGSDKSVSNKNLEEEAEEEEEAEGEYKRESGEPAAPHAPANAGEVEEFANANNITNVDPERFFTYYAARGWAGIMDWKMAVRAWAANEKKQHPPNRRTGKPKNTFNGFAQHDYDFEAIEKELLKGGTQT